MSTMLDFLEKNDRSPVPGVVCPESDPQQEEATVSGSWLLCGLCGARITRSSFACNVEGKHEHRYVNPEGIPYEVACFAQAPGCMPVGEITAYFSWFRGYKWRALVCSGCELHLGWLFKSTSHQFFGLIATRLVEES